jgi:hypothetical protein
VPRSCSSPPFAAPRSQAAGPWSGWRQLFSRAALPELLSGCAVAAFSQANGINAILFYTPAVFTSLQLGQHAALLSATVIGGTLFLGTLVSMVLVDRWGGAWVQGARSAGASCRNEEELLKWRGTGPAGG